MYCGHGVTSDFKVWSRSHSRISVDTNCVPGLNRKYSTYGSDHPLLYMGSLIFDSLDRDLNKIPFIR